MALYVNGELIKDEVIEEEVQRLRPEYERVFVSDDPKEIEANEKQLRNWSRENVIERVLIRQAAIKSPEPVESEIIRQQYDQLVEQAGGEENLTKQLGIKPDQTDQIKTDIENDLKVQRLIKKLTDKAEKPTEKQIRKTYEDDPGRFTIPEMVRASHIVIHPDPETTPQDARKQAEQVLKELQENDNFAEIASKYSSCPDDGGDLGFFPRGQMVQEFEDVVFNMEVGQISDVFETQFGFHIAKLTEKRPPIQCRLEDVTEVIEKELTEEAQQKEIEKFVDAEKEKAAIEEKNIITDI